MVQLSGEYEPSPTPWVCEQVATYERSRGQEAPPYADYQAKTERVIPVLLASPERSQPCGAS